jgi:hypothetical protein
VKSNLPPDEFQRAQNRVDPLLDVLRRAAERLSSDADSALIFTPGEQPE